MNINEVLNILVQAIATDGDIIEWAQINFNTKHIVYLAVDPDHPPVSTEAPFVFQFLIGKVKTFIYILYGRISNYVSIPHR